MAKKKSKKKVINKLVLDEDNNEEEKRVEFHEMGLDDRLLKDIAKLGWEKPTVIQEQAIPMILEGKDVLARARTGSGKTAAFVVPLIQKILLRKQRTEEQYVSTLVLTPSRELCRQAYSNIQDLSSSCSREVKCADVSGQVNIKAQRSILMEKPDIVVGTPGRILQHLQCSNLDLKESLEMLVIDEADLVFSFGYESDLKALLEYLPKIYQSVLMSATLSEEVLTLKKLVLHNPVILKLEDSDLPDTDQLMQYHVKCCQADKFLLIFTLLKLKLIRGKTIIFVNTIDRCIRLKLFLEQFKISSCVLNSELPVNSRCHIVNQFNSGLYDIIIASDESVLLDTKSHVTDQEKPRRDKRKNRAKEYGVSRGIDFQNVSNVINFDFPPSLKAYIHRVGRTARGDQLGTSLSFVGENELEVFNEIEGALQSGESASSLKPYQFRMSEIEGFRYRAQDALRAVTKVAVKEARLKEIKSEILNSKKLKTYFDDNPRDLKLLRHDKALHSAKVHSELSTVPDYLVPKALKGSNISYSRKRANPDAGSRRAETKAIRIKKKKEENPLKSFKFKRSSQT
ncbi:probable ATP-dependent RNA helicase DDX56 [Anneissia japonica]|uniref:probable ATP-dependent RNA helicase DDX56 n=1 Tax=Anneissia japonica TaxID=1529436 RepID=UPI001425B9C6|nr:probable ATP-dependent RNA helicase DDX56 [Anneissia japonica]